MIVTAWPMLQALYLSFGDLEMFGDGIP